jgi:hypothetical protein
MDRDAMNERMIKWLRWLTKSGSPRQDMIGRSAHYVALSGTVVVTKAAQVRILIGIAFELGAVTVLATTGRILSGRA